MDLIRIFQKLTHKVGVSIRPYTAATHPDKRLANSLKYFDIDLILDIGANVGQFAQSVLDNGYSGKIISFEPIKNCHEKLTQKAKSVKNWVIYDQGAIGSKEEWVEINISKNSVSSSILGIKKAHIEGEPDSKYIAKEKVKVRRLDDVIRAEDFFKKIFIKIDVQGFEMEVLKGGQNVLNQASLVSIELSLVPMYENNGIIYTDVIKYMEDHGFYLFGVQTGFVNKETGQVLQADGLFAKKDN
jgi:FkbM family methyltransferase